MKTKLLSLLLVCLSAAMAYSAVTYSLNEGFENGIPASWTQESANANVCNWVAESGESLTYPAGAFEGTGRAAFRNPTGQSQGDQLVTKLITPVMDLSQVANPQLTFAYAQALRSRDFDSLKVYYRTSATSPWVLLKSYSEGQNAWTEETLALIAPSAAYQVAFEAYDNVARGVVLDAVRVYPESQCSDVENIGVIAMSTSADIFWQGDMGRTFEIIVSNVPIDDLATYDVSQAVYYSNTITMLQATVTGLTSSTKYYVYVRSDCDDNPSGHTAWADASFTTSVGFPFFADFSTELPADWQNMYGTLEDAYAGNPLNAATSSNKWTWTSNTTVLGASHVVGRVMSVSSSYYPTWLISPSIDLTNVSAQAIELSCRMALSGSATAATEYASKDGYRFHVIVSDDAGQTWTAAKTTTLEGANMSATGTRVRVDMIPYKGSVVKVAFVADGNYATPYFHLGDIKLDEYDINCGGASNLKVVPRDVDAVASWTVRGKDDVVVQWSASSSFASLLGDETIAPADHQFTLSGLTSNTTYYVRVKQDCPDADWVTASFTTALGLPFMPTFSTSSFPSTWKRLSGTSAAFFKDSCTTTTSGWSLSNSYVWTNYHFKDNIYSTNSYWFVTPAVYLNGDVAPNVLLQFKVAVTAYNSSSQPAKSSDDRLWVVVSEDGGLTWNRANATLWSCNAADNPQYDYNEIPATGQQYKIDLTQYIGKTIAIAFGGESSTLGTDNDLHINNIVIKGFDPACAGLSQASVKAEITEAVARWITSGTQSAVAQLATNSTFTTGLVSDTVTGVDTVLFSGLEANSKYYFRAKQNCGDGEWCDVITFTTHCQPDIIPYQMYFEDETNGNDPSCWTIIRSEDGYPKVGSSTTTAHSGGKYLNYGTSNTTKDSRSWASLPAFDKNVSELEMSFWLRAYSESGCDLLEVGVMSDPLDTNTFVRMMTFAPKSIEYQMQSVSFAGYKGTGKYITFHRVPQGTNHYPFIVDDIDVYVLPSCYRMGEISLTDIKSNGVTVRFDMTNADDYQFVVATAPVNPDSAATTEASKVVYNEVVPSTGSYTIEDAAVFAPNKTHYIYVRGICGEEDKGAWSNVVSFTTLCAPYTVQEFGTETFDNAQNMQCWTTGFQTVPEGAYSSWAYAERTMSASDYGAYLKLSKEYTGEKYKDGAYAITPELNLGSDSINKYQITFTAATTNSSSSTNVKRLNVGVVTHPDQLDTYELIKTISLDFAADSTQEKTYVVSFADYQGDYQDDWGRYVMFQSVAGTDSTNYVLIDNISFELASGCQQVIDAQIDSAGLNGAKFSWEDKEAAQYEVLVSTVNTRKVDTLATAEIAFRSIVSGVQAELTGLASSTQYFAYVRGICGVGDTAKWSNSVAFRTALGVPYLETFAEFGDGCPNGAWKGYRGAFIGPDVVSVESETVNTTNTGWSVGGCGSFVTGMADKAVITEIYGTGYNALLVSDRIQLGEPAAGMGYCVTFKAAAGAYSSAAKAPSSAVGNATDHFLKIYVSEDGVNFTKIASWEVGKGDHEFNDIKGTAIKGLVDLTAYKGKAIFIGFATGTESSSTPDTNFMLDSVAVDEYDTSCGGVSQLAVSLSGLSATASWRVTGNPQASVIDIARDNAFTDIIAHDSLVNVFTKTVNGLEYSSEYFVRVKQGGCDNAQWVVTSFKTPVGLPFKAALDKGVPAGWTLLSGDADEAVAGTKAPTAATSGWSAKTALGGSVGMNLYNSNKYWLVTPLVNMVDAQGETVLLTFDAAYTHYNTTAAETPYSGDRLEILVSTDNGATWTAVKIWKADGTGTDPFTLTNSLQTYTVDLSAFAGQSVLIAFHGGRYTNSSSPDVDLHIANVLLKQQVAGCVDPTDLHVDSVGIDYVALSWSGTATNPTAVEIATDADFTMDVIHDTIPSGLNAVITGLNHSTAYYVHLRQICQGAVTEFTATVPFATACGAVTAFPWTEDFEKHAAGIFADPCWRNELVAGTGINVFKVVTTTNASNATHQLQLPDQTAGTKVLLALPEMVIPQADAYEFGLDIYRNTYTSGIVDNEGVRIFVSRTDTVDATAVELAFIPREYSKSSATVPVEAAVGWYTYKFTIPMAGACHIIVMGESQYKASTTLDNFLVRELPSCPEMKNIQVGDITAHSATVSFADLGLAGYQVLATLAEINPDTLDNVADSLIAFNSTVTDTVAVIENLLAITPYYAYVRGVCAASEGAWSKAVTWTTDCDPMTLTAENPYVMDFENVTIGTGTAPLCWTVLRDGGAYPYVYESSIYAHSGSKMLYFGGSSGVNKTQYAILPEVTNEVNALRIDFFMRGYSSTKSANDSILIGVMSDPSDPASFVRIQGFQAASTNYEEHEVALDGYAGEGKYVAIKRVPVRSGSYSYYYYGSYIDDITLSLIPSCYPLVSVAASNVERCAMDINWVAREGVENCENYQLVISPVELAPADLATVTPVVVDTTYYHATMLERDTRYYIYVRANCGAEDGTSTWISTSVATKPLGPDCSKSEMTLVPSGNGSTAIQYLPWSDYYNSTYSQQIYTAAELAAQGLTAGYISKVAFQYALNMPYTKTVTLYLGTTNKDRFTSSDDYLQVGQVMQPTDITFSTQNAWYEMEFDAPVYWNGTDNIVIAAKCMGTNYPSSGTATFIGGTTTNEMAKYSRIDSGDPETDAYSYPITNNRANIQFMICQEGFACPAVDSVAVSDITSETAMVSWTASTGDYANTYDVFYCDSIVTDWTGVVPQFDSIAGLSQELTGLVPYTDYYVYVRCNCDAAGHEDGSSDWAMAAFHTKADCNEVTNIRAEVLTKTSALVTWNHTDQEDNFQYILSDVELTEEELETTPLTASGIADTAVTLTEMTPGAKFMYIANNCGGTAHSPYRSVRIAIPDVCPYVADLTADRVAFNSVMLSWKRGRFGEETEWEVGVVGDDIHTQTVYDSSAVIIGLLPETAYTLYVKAVCGAGDSSTVVTLDVVTPEQPADAKEIGEGTSSTYNIPFCANFKNGWNQSIYSAELIGRSGQILSIAYHRKASSSTLTDSETKIYLAHTPKTVTDNTSDWIPEADLVLVAEINGFEHQSDEAWVTIPLDMPFEYNGTDNLAVVVSSRRPSYSSSIGYYYTSMAGNVTLYRQNDNDASYAEYPGTGIGTQSTSLPNIRFGFESDNCPKPVDLTVSDTTATSSVITWFPGGSEMQWAVYHSAVPMTDAALAQAVLDTVKVMSKSYEELTPATGYYFYIRSLCSATEAGKWKELQYRTLATCMMPEWLDTLAVTAEEAYVAWRNTNDGFTGTYQLVYGTADNFDLEVPSTYQLESVTDTFVTITGLTPQTEYKYAIRANCGGGDFSFWTPVRSFKTACLAEATTVFNFDDTGNRYVLYSYTSSSYYGTTTYEYYMENCWNGIGSGTESNAVYPQVVDNETYEEEDWYGDITTETYTYAYSGEGALALQSNSTHPTAAIMPIVNADLDTLKIHFMGRAGYDYQTDDYYSYASTGMQGMSSSYARSVRVGTMTDPNDMSTFIELAVFTQDAVASNTDPSQDPKGTNFWREYDLNLEGAVGQYVAFVSDFEANNLFFIDDVQFMKADPCVMPNGLRVNNVTKNSADVSWLKGKASTYEVRVIADDTTSVMVNDTNAVTLTLLPGVTYAVSLRSICDEDLYSEWTDAVVFVTECLPDVPVLYDFDDKADRYIIGETTKMMQNCWKVGQDEVNLSYIPYVTNNSGNTKYAYSGESSLYFYHYRPSYSSTTVYPDSIWAVMPELNTDRMDTLELSFKMRAVDEYSGKVSSNYTTDSYAHKIKVGVVSDPNSMADFQLLGEFDASPVPSSAPMTSDPNGRSFWEIFRLPLDGVDAGKHIVFLSDYTLTNYIWIDDVKVGRLTTCMEPTDMQVTNIGLRSADVAWNSDADAFNVLLLSGNDTATYQVDEANISFTTLTPSTTYTVKVQTVCADGVSDEWATAVFSTKNGIPFEEDFAGAIPSNWSQYTGLVSGVMAGTTQLAPTTSKWSVSTSLGTSVKSNIYGTSANNWIVSPEIDLRDNGGQGVQLSFDVALTAYAGSGTPDFKSETDDKFIVLVSPDGGQSWQILQTWASDGSSDESYRDFTNSFKTQVLDLSEFASGSVMIAFYGESTVSNADLDLHIANVSVNTFNKLCQGVEKLKVSDVSMSGATVTFSYKGGNTDAVIALSKEAALDLSRAVLVDTVRNDSSYILPPMDASSTYYVYVEQLCDEGETSAWTRASFNTPLGVRYQPVFESTTMPSDWSRYTGLADAVFAGTPLATSTSGWSLNAADTVIDAIHFRGNIYGTSWNYWVVTPAIDLTSNLGEGLMLTVDLGLTPYSASSADNRNSGVDDRFMVVVSEDGGATWSETNATVWSNDSLGDYTYNDVPENGGTYRIDMTRYAGKVIKIGFYGESTVSNADNYFHFGNIILDRCEAENYSAAVCEGEDYQGYGFDIKYMDIQPGLNVFSRFIPAKDESENDTVKILNLWMEEAQTTEYSVTVCEGEHFVDENFDFIATLGMNPTQKRRLESQYGCDSTVVAIVTVLPTIKVDSFATTCKGVPFQWKGEDLYLPGNYPDTATSAVTGCDSITVLHLSVTDGKTTEINKTLCFGESVVIDGKTVTESGDYTEIFPTASGCDSTVIWHVTALPKLASHTNAAICVGETYSDNTFKGLSRAGKYEITAKSVAGCDSLVTLKLMVYDNVNMMYDTVSTADLPYVVNGVELLGAGVAEGTYVRNVTLNCGTAQLTIIVGTPTGLDNVRTNSLVVAPNPVSVGQDIRILNDFSATELQQMSVDVYSHTGALVYHAENLSEPLVVPGLNAAGVHTVRLTTANGVYIAPVVVR